MILRDPVYLSDETRELWTKQEGLIKVYNLPFRLFETLRTLDRQKECFASKVSKTMNSMHLMNEEKTGSDAWDVAEWKMGGWSWDDVFFFQVLGILTLNLIKGIKWGADWNGKNFWYDEDFRDYGHFERIR